jgi:hypothetical protein
MMRIRYTEAKRWATSVERIVKLDDHHERLVGFFCDLIDVLNEDRNELYRDGFRDGVDCREANAD